MTYQLYVIQDDGIGRTNMKIQTLAIKVTHWILTCAKLTLLYRKVGAMTQLGNTEAEFLD